MSDSKKNLIRTEELSEVERYISDVNVNGASEIVCTRTFDRKKGTFKVVLVLHTKHIDIHSELSRANIYSNAKELLESAVEEVIPLRLDWLEKQDSSSNITQARITDTAADIQRRMDAAKEIAEEAKVAGGKKRSNKKDKKEEEEEHPFKDEGEE
jgi:hypothetical protein